MEARAQLVLLQLNKGIYNVDLSSLSDLTFTMEVLVLTNCITDKGLTMDRLRAQFLYAGLGCKTKSPCETLQLHWCLRPPVAHAKFPGASPQTHQT